MFSSCSGCRFSPFRSDPQCLARIYGSKYSYNAMRRIASLPHLKVAHSRAVRGTKADSQSVFASSPKFRRSPPGESVKLHRPFVTFVRACTALRQSQPRVCAARAIGADDPVNVYAALSSLGYFTRGLRIRGHRAGPNRRQIIV